eukprot:TRINITY_DN1400_c3_g1_i1.p1 TRINITY_DN1400_c3_g1~~TRINITY_DN1400_c3_g1_i1.p1  ORF type:complete len:373 (+),score=109.44 TRINITY_DN1400_c3_g1_i1:58-1176(+)
MAKIGEGDPRWRVSERQDGKNVNSWHWEEKDITKNLIRKIKEFYAEREILKDEAFCKITSVPMAKGEALYCVRKGRKFLIYDLNIKMKWKGTIDNENHVTGEVRIPSLESDTKIDETKVAISGNGNNAEIIRQIMIQKGITEIKESLKAFFQELLDSYQTVKAELPSFNTEEGIKIDENAAQLINSSDKVMLVNKSNSDVTLVQNNNNNNNNNNNKKTTSSSPSPYIIPISTEPKKKKIKTKTITQIVKFSAPTSEIYECLIDSQRLSAFTGTDASISRDVGSKFKLFDGNIEGEIVELVPNGKIVQKWRFNSWPENHFSVVTLKFETVDNKCKVTLKHGRIPSDDVQRTKEGWKNFFWRRIKGTFGYSYTM